jgi:hypothetical protein
MPKDATRFNLILFVLVVVLVLVNQDFQGTRDEDEGGSCRALNLEP